MLPAIALSFALFAPQAGTTITTPPSDPPASSTTPLRRIGGGVTPPKVIYQVDPEFTKEARKSKMSGMTLVNLIVDANGNPQNVHVVRSMADTVDKKHRQAALTLDQKAIDAVKKYRFTPATEGGKPVAVELNVMVNFQIF